MAEGLFDDGKAKPPPDAAGHRQRLRQRLLAAGAAALADHELLELILFQAIPRRDVKPLAKALLRRFGSFAGVIAAEPQALQREAGISEAAAAAIHAVYAASLRYGWQTVAGRTVISSFAQLMDYLYGSLAEASREEFHVLFLDRKNRLMRDEALGQGTIDHTPVYPREVMRRALELSAAAIILVHNHPSGDPKPSKADIEMTRQLVEAGKSLGITVHDHLIVARDAYVSFRNEGLL